MHLCHNFLAANRAFGLFAKWGKHLKNQIVQWYTTVQYKLKTKHVGHVNIVSSN